MPTFRMPVPDFRTGSPAILATGAGVMSSRNTFESKKRAEDGSGAVLDYSERIGDIFFLRHSASKSARPTVPGFFERFRRALPVGQRLAQVNKTDYWAPILVRSEALPEFL